jgi:hypothetical protein
MLTTWWRCEGGAASKGLPLPCKWWWKGCERGHTKGGPFMPASRSRTHTKLSSFLRRGRGRGVPTRRSESRSSGPLRACPGVEGAG